MEINRCKAIINKQVWLSDVEGVSDELKTYLRESSRYNFRFLRVDNNGDTVRGCVCVQILGQFLGEELDPESSQFDDLRKELYQLWRLADAQNIKEIIFN